MQVTGEYNGHPITRAEYDDGAAIIDGKPCPTAGAQLRVRYVTPYNFIIASQGSPINNSHFDQQLDEMFVKILKGKTSLEELAKEVLKLPKIAEFNEYR
jgi:hypothetical protein